MQLGGIIREKGFSLLEVIGVLAVMGILFALIAPNVINQIDDATRDAESRNLRGIAQAVELYLRETHAFPATLSVLSPGYLPFGDAQLSQNPQGFSRYYVLHPTMASFDNAAGIAANEIPDTRFLLISNLDQDATPTITNATEFDAWWNTDETGTPGLKIERRNVGALFHLLNVSGRVPGGSFQVDGVPVNSLCIPLSHTRYHLVGTVIGLDEASTYSVPEIHLTLISDTGYHWHSGYPAGAQWRTVPVSSGKAGGGNWSLWLTTENDVTGSGVPCLDSWADAEILQFGNPNLAFEPGTTSGTFSSAVNMENFSLGGLASLTAIHRVTKNITVGSFPSFNLLAGDLLLVHEGNSELFILPPIITSNKDVFVFRPLIPGDYSAGTVFMLLHDLGGGGILGLLFGTQSIHSISLVETNTVVGDTTLAAGTFLFSTSGGTKNDIKHFSPTGVGWGTTSGTVSTLLDGLAIGIANSNQVQGLDLIETTLTIGDITLAPGTVLVTLQNDDSSVGNNNISTKKQDIFYLTVTSTEMGSGTSVANATLLLEGTEVGLDTNNENLIGISVAPAQ